MFKYKQSSLPTIFFVNKTSYCKHAFPSENAFKMPDHPGCLTGGYQKINAMIGMIDIINIKLIIIKLVLNYNLKILCWCY